jgi:hypothetical protein
MKMTGATQIFPNIELSSIFDFAIPHAHDVLQQ